MYLTEVWSMNTHLGTWKSSFCLSLSLFHRVSPWGWAGGGGPPFFCIWWQWPHLVRQVILVPALSLLCNLRGISSAGSSDKGELIGLLLQFMALLLPGIFGECLLTGRIRPPSQVAAVWERLPQVKGACQGGGQRPGRKELGERRHPSLISHHALLFPYLGGPFPLNLPV